jgi:initiation factor 1A
MKNTIGGKRFKKGKKNTVTTTRKFPKKSDVDFGETFFYGQVINVLGGKNVLLLDLERNIELIGIICGSMYKKEWLKKDDILLCSQRVELSNEKKCDIVFKYTNDEVKILKKMNEIQYHDKIKNSLVDNIFNNNFSEEEDSEVKEVEVAPQELVEELRDSDIDDI